VEAGRDPNGNTILNPRKDRAATIVPNEQAV